MFVHLNCQFIKKKLKIWKEKKEKKARNMDDRFRASAYADIFFMINNSNWDLERLFSALIRHTNSVCSSHMTSRRVCLDRMKNMLMMLF